MGDDIVTAARLVYPRLDAAVWEELLGTYADMGVADVAELAGTYHSRVSWYETATARVTDARLSELRAAVLDVAKDEGYPVPTPRRYASFDQRVGPMLLDRMQIVPADAAHSGVWAFLSLVLLPDVAVWRWDDNRHRHRFTGKQHRDTFRRLWSRAYLLGDRAAGDLLEDEFGAILERTSLGGDKRVARVVAETHLDAVTRDQPVSRTALLRETMKRLRRIAMVVHFPALTEAQLRQLTEDVYRETRDVLASPVGARS